MRLVHLCFVLLPLVIVTGCAPVVLQEIPAGGSIAYKKIVLVENDGRCGEGEVIRITGGSNKEKIPREYACVARPK